MNCYFGRSSEKVFICLFPVFAALSLLLGATAKADIYDDFSGKGIDTGKWAISDPKDLFSQPGDGHLHFYSDNSSGLTPAPGGSLISTRSFTTGFFSLNFSKFSSTNRSPSNQGLGSFAAIGLGTRTKYVRMLRGRVVSERWGYFEANYYDGTSLHVWYIFTDVTSGQLGLVYDGSTVDFFYNNGMDGWKKLEITGPDTKGRIVKVTPGWSSPPPLFISGTPGASGLTKFSAESVQFEPVLKAPILHLR